MWLFNVQSQLIFRATLAQGCWSYQRQSEVLSECHALAGIELEVFVPFGICSALWATSTLKYFNPIFFKFKQYFYVSKFHEYSIINNHHICCSILLANHQSTTDPFNLTYSPLLLIFLPSFPETTVFKISPLIIIKNQ